MLLVITINDLILIKSIINNLNIDHKLINYLLLMSNTIKTSYNSIEIK